MSLKKNKFKLAICQMKISKDKYRNLHNAGKLVRDACRIHGPDMVVLPEMFNCPYSYDYFARYAEGFPGDTTGLLSSLAAELNIYIIGGSIPESDGNKIFNTSFIFKRNGELLARHRKIHLFDVNISNGISFNESKYISAGNNVTVFDTDVCRTGVAICYDMRFPELIRKMSLDGALLIIVPAAFNMTTGPAHWHITARTRALDNQVYFACASPSRDIDSEYTAYGHSLIADPWGSIIAEAGIDEEIICATIEIGKIKKIRDELPLLKHRKPGLYWQ